MKILLACIITSISVRFIIAKSSAFTCPKNHFSFNYDCYKCSSCPPEISPSENECTEIWGLSPSLTCAPGYRFTDNRDTTDRDADKSSTATNPSTRLQPSVSSVSLTNNWLVWVLTAVALAFVVTAMVAFYLSIKLHWNRKKLKCRFQEAAAESEGLMMQIMSVLSSHQDPVGEEASRNVMVNNKNYIGTPIAEEGPSGNVGHGVQQQCTELVTHV